MDKNTFGGSGAPVNVVSILEKPENRRYTKKTSKILSKYLVSLKAIMFIPDKNTRETALKMWRVNYIGWIESSKFPLVLETHLKCCVIGWYREFLKKSCSTGGS